MRCGLPLHVNSSRLRLENSKEKARKIPRVAICNSSITRSILDLLSFVLRNSYFSFQEVIYQQVFGCVMSSPVSALIAELVMQEVEEKALATSIVQPRWWRRYVDDANACLTKTAVQQFHDHLNSINPHIQFTVEMPDMSSQEPSIAFLDTSSSRSADGQVKVKVYRKATHTGKYLSFGSHSPAQSKRAVVRSLMDRAHNLPSTPELKQQEEQRVTFDLTMNGYPPQFVNNCRKSSTQIAESEETPVPRATSFTSIPYVQGNSERIKRTLNKANIKTTFKPFRTLENIFRKPKDRTAENRVKGIVYKVQCRSCSFNYIGESKRSWSSRGDEHKPRTRAGNFQP